MTRYIKTDAELAELAAELADSRILCIDTEFIREKTYYAQLCLVQVNNGKISALIDPLAIRDFKPFGKLLADRAIMKVFHAGSQDISILYHETGIVATPVFDTQTAAALLGYPLQLGYGPLVRSMCGVRLNKADGYTDWSRRPLSNNQLKYALEDVLYLPQIYDDMVKQLTKTNRLKWLDHEFSEMSNPAKYSNNPRDMWLRVKRVSTLSRQQLSIAREVAAWREEQAKHRDVPRKWVLSDEAIIEIARKAPSNASTLLEIRGLTGHLGHKPINQILECVRKAVDMPQSQWPSLPKHAKGNKELVGAASLMQAIVELRSKENDVAVPVLASHDELARLAKGHREGLAVLESWRYEMVGHELLDLLEGKCTVRVGPEGIEVIHDA